MGLTPVDQFVLALVRIYGESATDRVSRVVYRKREQEIDLWIWGFGEGDRPLYPIMHDSVNLRDELQNRGEDFVRMVADVLFRRVGLHAIPGHSSDPNVVVWLRG